MKVAFVLKKTPVVFILILCFVVSFNFVEGGRSIRLKKVKTHIAPRHISLSARSGNGAYARTYAYGGPIPSYSTKGKVGKNRRYYSERRRYGKREYKPRTYANKYRNWSPNAKKNPRTDKIGQLKRRKELLPFLIEPPFGPNMYKRRIRPRRPTGMQRPKPPKPNREEFEDEYFFPEEAKRAETKYEFESRYPKPKKKRRPEFESYHKTPNLVSKIPYYDEKPMGYKAKPREPSFSYSSFVQHPSGSSSGEPDDFYEDSDSIYSQPVIRNKKKRVKKKSNSRKKNKEQYKPFVFENDPAIDSYPPYISPNDYDLPAKSYKKRNKPTYDSNGDDEFLPSKGYAQPPLHANNLFSADSDYNNPKTQQLQFNPSYSQTWSQTSVTETTAPPLQYQTENGFQPQQYVPNHYNYNKDYSTLQKTKTVTTNTQQSTYYSHPDNSYKSVAYSSNNNNYASHNQISATQSQSPTNYNTYSGNYNQVSSTYSQPLPASSSVLTDVTIQKSVPIYDNTETFYNFNNNAYVNSQSSKYYNSDTGSKYYDTDNSQNYGTRLSTSATSNRNKLGEKPDSESEFLKKHQNLYNKGLSGVPVQGDGYAKESVKKDYDIGYGDFQFDENPNT